MAARIQVRHLRAYNAIVMTGSVTAAAKRVHLSQPAVSRLLADLETELGFLLFNRRRGGRMEQTEQGRLFYREVEGTLIGIEDLPSIAESIKLMRTGRLRIAGTAPMVSTALLPAALSRLSRDFADLKYSIDVRHRLDIEEWVVNRNVDIGLALLPVEHAGIETLSIGKVAVVAVVARDHPLAGRDHLTAADVMDESVILVKHQPIQYAVEASMLDLETRLTAVIEVSSAMTGCFLAANSHGIAICDPFSPTPFADKVRVIPWRPVTPLDFGCLYQKDRPLAEVPRLFVEYLKDAVRDLLTQEPAGIPVDTLRSIAAPPIQTK